MRILEFIFHLSIMILSILFLYHYNIFWPKSDGTAFTLKILKAEQGNQVFSPINIAHAFGLLLLGAGGETEKEISNILGYGKNPSPNDLKSTKIFRIDRRMSEFDRSKSFCMQY